MEIAPVSPVIQTPTQSDPQVEVHVKESVRVYGDKVEKIVDEFVLYSKDGSTYTVKNTNMHEWLV